MMRSIAFQPKLFLACVIALNTSAFAQSQFEVLENRFLAHMSAFRSEPSTLNQAELRRLINDIQSYDSSPNLAAIEKFTLPYYQGYLYYIHGQHDKDASMLDRAANRFRAAVRAYEPEVRLPDKRAFATYMEAWCELRKYLISSNPIDFQPLQAAHQLLRRLAADVNAQFMVDDIHFLKGLSQYLIAKRRFERLEFDGVTLDEAKASLALVSDRDDDLYKLSRLYLATSHLLSARYWALSQLEPDQRGIVSKDSAMTNAYRAAEIFNTLPDFGSMANFDYYLSSRYGSVLGEFDLDAGKVLFDQAQLEFSGVEPNQRNLLEAYSYFLNYLSNGISSGRLDDAGHESESRFWENLTDYLIYLSGNGEQPVNLASLFEQPQINDWRGEYLKALQTFYRNEANTLGGSLGHVEVDTLYLMPFHRKRAHYLHSLVRLQEGLGVQVDILNLVSVKDLVLSNPEAAASGYSSVFGAMDDRNKRDVYGFANYLLTLADKNRNLYSAAYLTYEYLNSLGYLREKTTLLKAYCEYRWQGRSEQDNHDALTLLSDENIGTFSNHHRAEAIYYRAMFYRKIDGPQYSSRVVQEMESIQDNHPYAGYGLGYEQFSTVDVDLMNQVYTQVCKQDESLKELCDACTSITGYNPEEVSAPAVHIGDPDVRFENLKDLRLEFVQAEKEFLVDYWQVFSAPLQIAVPGTNRQLICNIPGPREFYIGNRIKVNLALGKPDTLKQMTVSSRAEGCQTLSATDAVQKLEVLALRSYENVVATQGHYPTHIKVRFQNNEETVSVAYDDALAPLGAFAREDSSTRVDSASDYYIASLNNDRFLRLYHESGRQVLRGDQSYSAIERVGSKYYLLDRLSNQAWEMDDGGTLRKLTNFDESVLDKPSDLTGFGNHLVIANSGNNTVVSYNLQNRTTQLLALAEAGRIESIVAMGGKLYVTDWIANVIWVGDLGGFERLASTQDAVQDSMLAPTQAKILMHRYLVVTTLLGNDLFVFDETGTYLDVVRVRPDPRGIHDVRYVEANGQRAFRIYAYGSGPQLVEKKTSYNFDLRCGDDFTDLGGPSDEKSRFCLLPRD